MNIVLINNLYIDESLLVNLKNKLFSYGHSFNYYLENATSELESIKRIKDAEILIIDNHKITNDVLSHATKLKYIIVAFTGFDHIDVNYCKDHNIKVSNCSGYATEAVAELTVGLIISYFRNIINFDSNTRKSLDKMDILGNEIQNKTVGLIGYGKIGKQVSKLLENFDVNLLIYSHHKIHESSQKIKQVGLEYLLTNSDIISIHVPLNESTKGLIGSKELTMMKENCVLINTARGPIIDTSSLVKCLKNHSIKGACLDVYDVEPPIKDKELLSLDSVILLPHVGYFTKEAMKKRFDIVEEILFSYLIESKILNRIV